MIDPLNLCASDDGGSLMHQLYLGRNELENNDKPTIKSIIDHDMMVMTAYWNANMFAWFVRKIKTEKGVRK